jgi:putative ABC transport system permease protein
MSTVTRGARNAFRNPIRTASIIALLGISTALALALFLANQAMKTKVTELKASAATTLTINAAGSFGGEGGGEPLKAEDITKVKNLANVSEVGAVMTAGGGMFRVSPGSGPGGTAQATVPKSEVALDSSIDPGTLGTRRFRAGSGTGENAAKLAAIKLPVSLSGLEGILDRTGQALKITSGTAIFSTTDVAEALVGQALATKNNLKIGSTFTAYSTTFKVVGIFDAGSQFANDGLYVPLVTAQRLTGQPDEVSQIFARADSIENMDAVKTAIGNALGNSRVDITSAAQSTAEALAALQGIQQIAFTGMIVTLGAAAVITFLVMVMTVRERRREIGVLKAIGASNFKIVSQFVSEALVLTMCGALVGVALAALTSNQITGALISSSSSNTSSSTSEEGPRGPRGGGFAARMGDQAKSAEDLVKNIKTNVGLPLLLEGLGAGILIAVVGSAIPAWFIAKVRPAEVMRGE